MPVKNSETPQKIYQLKVTLLRTSPPIWRRLLVPADLTLEQLHDVLQAAMGWEDCHMHDFRVGSRRFGKPLPDEEFGDGPVTASERTTRMFDVLRKVGAKAVYTYDFGDGWKHGIVLEKMLALEAGRDYPACIDGKRHGPPEDCGGVWGFYNLLDAISNPEHDEHEEASECLGDDFDPEAFSVDDVNRWLAPLQQKRNKIAAAEK